jgi:predicted unusual protein kinase regulating ubiquinone biosynthesis (AarF/ABC1/UbiB family)
VKIKANHLQRYRQIARLLWKYGRSDLVRQMALDDPWDKENPAPPGNGEASPEHLADELEAMGPTFVKLGQVLSSRPDLLPEPYIRALSRLQDRVKPFDGREAAAIVEGELGARLSKAFQRFELEPIAAASLGQVHEATLRDGREVVVKVQRPGIVAQVADDFEVLRQICEFLEDHVEVARRHRILETLEHFKATMQHELDYEREATNLVNMGDTLADFPEIVVPQPVPDYCTRRVLTMDFVRGYKITKVSPIARLEMDGCTLAESLFRAYLKQVLVDGIFHADPHPGNVFLTDDYRLALLDLGMVGRTSPRMQTTLLKILIAISEDKSEDVATLIIDASETAEEFDEPTFRRRITDIVSEQSERSLQQLNVGTTLLQVARVGVQVGLFVPSELTMLGKTLLQLDEVGKILDPDFDPDAAIRRNVTDIMTKRLAKDTSKGSFFATLLDMKQFVAALPVRLNKIMDAVTNKDLELKVRAVDAPIIMEGLQKIANRVTTGLILAALIVGASLMMRIETSWTILGYPGLAILCFLAAAAGGFYLVINIFVQDRRSQHKAHHPG